MEQNKRTSYAINAVSVIGLFFLLQFLISSGVVNRYWQGIFIMVCINIILAVSLNLTTGLLGEMALGHAGFMSIGAYTAAIITTSIGLKGKEMAAQDYGIFILALIMGGIVAGFVGLLVGLPALRLRGDYLAIITLGFGEIIRSVIENLSITGGAQGLRGIAKISSFEWVYWITVIVIVLLFTLKNSRQGRAIMAIRDDDIASQSTGINNVYYKTMAFVIAAFFAGVAGGLFAHYIGILGASSFGFMRSIEILVIVVLGGMGSFTGSIIAAIVLTVLPEILREFADYRMLVYSLVLIVMMIFRPAGLLGRYEFSLTRTLSKVFGKKGGTNHGHNVKGH